MLGKYNTCKCNLLKKKQKFKKKLIHESPVTKKVISRSASSLEKTVSENIRNILNLLNNKTDKGIMIDYVLFNYFTLHITRQTPLNL